MKTIKDFLSPREIGEYNEGWSEFKGRYKLNTSKNVHSGMPVISEVYRFKESPIFRAHVFGRKLRKFDPYFISDGFTLPFWDATHLFLVFNQFWTASAKEVVGEEYDKVEVLEVPVELRLTKKIYFDDNVSVELIADFEKLRKGRGLIYATVYSDKSGEVLTRGKVIAEWHKRRYVEIIEKIKSGDKDAEDRLRTLIEYQTRKLRKITSKRDIEGGREIILEELANGNVPEEEIIKFFSLWE